MQIEIGGACSTYGDITNAYTNFSWKFLRKEHLGGIYINVEIILKCILETLDLRI